MSHGHTAVPRVVGVIAVVLLAVVALAFARTEAGAFALVVLVAMLGAAWARTVPSGAPRWRPASSAGRFLTVVVVLGASAAVILEAEEVRLQMGDWGIHELLVTRLVEGLDRGYVPAWLHDASTGDAPYELYPLGGRLLAASIARALDLRDRIPDVLAWVGIAAHVLVGVGTARMASRVAPWPFAAAVGLLAVVDAEHLFHAGAAQLLRHGMLDQTIGLAAALLSAVAVLDFLAKPTGARMGAIWILTAVTAALHPVGVLLPFASVVALLVVAATAGDVPLRRPLAAAGHLTLGVLLAAVVWMPYAERVLVHGASYPNASLDLPHTLNALLRGQLPQYSFAALAGAGWVGAAAGLLSRRAAPTFVAAVAVALTLAVTDLPLLFTGLAPSPTTGRFHALRMVALARPFLLVGMAYLGALALQHVRSGVRRVGLRQRMAAGALGAVILLLAARAAVPFVSDEVWLLRDRLDQQVPDPEGFEELVAWAEHRAEQARRGEMARLYFQGRDHFAHSITARTGLPVLHPGAIPLLFLRERMRDTSEESLRRFGIRWVARRGGSPALGLPETEQRFGTYRVREVGVWDGRFARIERGEGEVVVNELGSERVVVDLRGTDAPALVSLGTGWYPRWRAWHDGEQLPVYGLPVAPRGETHVVSAWLPPGRSVFTPDGPLPSDDRGELPSILALLAIGLIVSARLVPPLRRRVVLLGREIAAGAQGLGPVAPRVGLAAAATILLFAAVGDAARPEDSVDLMTGFATDAYVESRSTEEEEEDDEPPEELAPCEAVPAAGYVECGEEGRVLGAMSGLLGDEPFSWDWPTPSVVVVPRVDSEWRIVMRRELGGRYEAASFSRGGVVRLHVDGLGWTRLGREAQVLSLGPARERTLVLELDLPAGHRAGAVLVREGVLDPERQPPPVPPESPPAALLR